MFGRVLNTPLNSNRDNAGFGWYFKSFFRIHIIAKFYQGTVTKVIATGVHIAVQVECMCKKRQGIYYNWYLSSSTLNVRIPSMLSRLTAMLFKIAARVNFKS